MAYLNNIIIYFNNEKKYKEHMKWILQRFYNKQIPIIIKKCKFHIKKINFIEFIIKLGQIKMNLKKVKYIMN